MKALLLGLAAAICASTTMAAPATAVLGEKPLQATGPLDPLRGVLLTPSQSAPPVVLIVPGSGPTDRNGNSPFGLKASTYQLLAQELATQGIATVRIDKRGMFESYKAVEDPNAVTIQAYAEDVHHWVDAIRSETGAQCVWVLGHSEGGLVALEAGQGRSDICGLILVATPGRPMGQTLREQLKEDPANAPILDQALPVIDALEAGRRVDTRQMDRPLNTMFHASVQGFLINTFALDPARLIAGYSKPVLIIQGERDLQIKPKDAQRLAKAAPNAKLVLLPATNHVLKKVETNDRAANLATYDKEGLPLVPGVSSTIARFITSATVKR